MIEITNKYSSIKLNLYKDCIKRLNRLQGMSAPPADPMQRLTSFKSRLLQLGHKVQDLNELNIIHVAGTKGKGSTCLFSQQILMCLETVKVGMFTSPHMLEVRERIRINGKPISHSKFIEGFNFCSLRLKDYLEEIGYFQFLALLGFHLMIEERVDALVLEVGIGGLYDFTNVVEAPIVCGITKIEYDHQSILGNTLEQIAHNKAGIIKKNVECITIANQKKEVFGELARKAFKEKTNLEIARDYFAGVKLGIEGHHQKQNANLAFSLCKVWASKILNKSLEADQIKEKIWKSLQRTRFVGRSYKYCYKNIDWCLDGAHTEDSLNLCLKWFLKTKTTQTINKPAVLLMGAAAGREYQKFVEIAFDHQKKHSLFTEVVFVPNLLDQTRDGSLISECSDLYVHPKIKKNIEKNVHHKMFEHWNKLNENNTASVITKTNAATNHSLKTAIDSILERPSGLVLVTGSLHLVSSVLTLLDHPIE